MRAAQLDMYARTKFTREKDPVTESRRIVNDLLGRDESRVERSAESLAGAAGQGWVEVG